MLKLKNGLNQGVSGMDIVAIKSIILLNTIMSKKLVFIKVNLQSGAIRIPRIVSHPFR